MIHRRYNRQASLIAKDIDYNGEPVKPGEARDAITIAFGTGEVTGEFVQETLCLAVQDEDGELAEAGSEGLVEDRKLDGKDCVDMRVVTASEMTQEPFFSFAFDGVLGLGLAGLALAPEFSFFGSMVTQGRLGLPVFAVFLADDEDKESEITFGGYNPEHLQGELTWAPVALPDLGHWQVDIHGLRIGGVSLDFCGPQRGCRAVVDTGTSLLAVPKELLGRLQKEMGVPEEAPEVGCKHAKGPEIEFTLASGYTVTLNAEDLVRTPVAAPSNSTSQPSAGSPPKGESGASRVVCVPTMMPLELPEPLGPKLFILGEPVLRKYYTVYNWEEKKIGFGRVPSPGPPPQGVWPALRGSEMLRSKPSKASLII